MFIEDALVQILKQNTSVAAFVGTRIKPGFLAQSTAFPALAYRQVSESEGMLLEPPGTNGLVRARYRFFCTSKTYISSKQLDNALRLALTGFKGTVTDNASPSNSIEIQAIFPESLAADDYDDTTETYQFIRDFTVYAVKPTP